MVKLVDTPNLTKTRRLAMGGRSFIEIPAIGDGNCALYAFALGLIDLIKRNQLHLSADTYAELFQAITLSLPLLKERVKLYRADPADVSMVDGNEYTDIAGDLNDLIHFFESKAARDFTAFKHWIQSVSTEDARFKFAALHVALGPALRHMGVERSLKAIHEYGDGIARTRVAQLNELRHDAVEADQELLECLAHDIFHVNINTYDDVKHNGHYVLTSLLDDIPDAPTLSLTHVPGHWNYLLPAGQRDGLAVLPHFSEHMVSVLSAGSQQLAKPQSLTREKLNDIHASLEACAESLLTQEVSDPRIWHNLAVESGRIVSKTKQQLGLSRHALKNLGLHDMGIELILRAGEPLASSTSTDEALCRSLQNAEITAFFNKNYTTLTSPASGKSPRSASKNEHEDDEEPRSLHRY